jgi:hypothetical protein
MASIAFSFFFVHTELGWDVLRRGTLPVHVCIAWRFLLVHKLENGFGVGLTWRR